eukprot:12008060-Prorocentrum_lima.AAC.5
MTRLETRTKESGRSASQCAASHTGVRNLTRGWTHGPCRTEARSMCPTLTGRPIRGALLPLMHPGIAIPGSLRKCAVMRLRASRLSDPVEQASQDPKGGDLGLGRAKPG